MGTRIEMTLIDNTTKVYEEEHVVSANIVEANDPLCRELRASTLEVVLYSGTGEFDFFNSSEVLDKMAINQKVIVKYNFGNNITKQIGIYYVDEWEVEANDHLRLRCVDVIGLLDKHIFREDFDLVDSGQGSYYIRYPIGQFLEIVGVVADRQDLYQSYVTPGDASALEGGLLVRCSTPPILTCRELAMSIFAQYNLNLLFDAEGTPNLFSSGILYSPRNTAGRPYSDDVIRKNRIIFATNNNSVPPKIKAIEREIFIGEVLTDQQTIFKDKVGSGDITIYLDSNYKNYTITNGTIVSSTRNSITFRRSSSNAVVTIKANGYQHNTTIRRTQLLADGENGDVIRTQNALGGTLSFNISNINFYDYWNNGFVTTFDFLMNSDMKERAGTIVKVELEDGKAYSGVITELNIDLTGGMIATATILCNRTYEIIND